MTSRWKKNKQVILVLSICLIVSVGYFAFEYTHFSNLDRQAAKAELLQKSNIRMAIVAKTLEESVVELGELIAAHKESDRHIKVDELLKMLGGTHQMSDVVDEVLILHYSRRASDHTQGSLEEHSSAWDRETLEHFYSRTERKESANNAQKLFKTIENNLFINALQKASQLQQTQYYIEYLKPPLKADYSSKFSVIVPFNLSNSEHGLHASQNEERSNNDDLTSFVVINIDFSKVVLQALDSYIKVPGGVSFYIYDGEISPDRLILYHLSRASTASASTLLSKAVPGSTEFNQLPSESYLIMGDEDDGQNWKYVFVSTQNGVMSNLSFNALVNALIGVVFSLLLMIYLVFSIRDKKRFKQQVEEKVLEVVDSEKRLKSITDTAKDAIIVIDENSIITFWNAGAERLYGYDHTEALGNKICELIFSPLRIKEYLGSYRSFKELCEYEWALQFKRVETQHKEGGKVVIELNFSAITLNGEWSGIGFFHDIANRLAHEQSLMYKEEKLRTIVDTVLDGVIIIDEKGCIEMVNPMVEVIFGYSVEEMVGQNVKMLMPQPFRDAHDGYLNHYKDTKEKHIIGSGREVEGQRKDGSVLPLDLAVYEVKLDGNTKFIGMARDLTDRKKVENDLRESKESAEKANKAKSEFLSSMSHELRTPLNAILGYSQMMQYDQSLSSDLKSNVEGIYQAGDHLLNLINEVLDLATIEAGKMELSPEWCDVSLIIDQVCSLMQPVAKKQGISLSIAELCKGYVIYVDVRRIKQIILNFISNAIKYNRKNGRVEVLSQCDASGQMLIAVKDTGLGLSEQQRAGLFTPFNRLGAQFSDIEGTGIGLIITKELTELMGGVLGIDTLLGQGSTFSVSFPCEPSDVEEPVEIIAGFSASMFDTNSVQALQRAKMDYRILVAEDNAINRNVISRQLKLLGYQSEMAEDGQEAWELIQAGNYDLLLTDIHMPKMDGVELVKKIRLFERFGNHHLPVIAVTADAMDESQDGYLEEGMDDYLSKPIDIKALELLLLKWLQKHIEHTSVNVTQTAFIVQEEAQTKISNTTIEAPCVKIENLHALIGNDREQNCEILNQFIESTPIQILEINEALLNQDFDSIQIISHMLKSSARTIGAEALGDVAAKVEKYSKQQDLPLLQGEVVALQSMLNDVADYVISYCQIEKSTQTYFQTSMNEMLSVLVIDDDFFVHGVLSKMFIKLDIQNVHYVGSGGEGLNYLARNDSQVNIVFCDLNMPGMDGLKVLKHLAERDYNGAIILMSGEEIRVLNAANRLAEMQNLNVLGVLEKPIRLREVSYLLNLFESKTIQRSKREPEKEDMSFSRDELLRAIENDEFEAYYQPQISVKTAVPVGMEALVRWNHPEKGLINPMQFVPIMEQEGLIDALTEKVMQQAFSFTSKLIDRGVDIVVSVNVSGYSLTRSEWYDNLISEAEKANLAHEKIVVEVTESRLMEHPDIALEILTRLTMQNIGVAIDDFGTGFSSLEQLQRIPFKELKLDRSFVTKSDQLEENRIILTSTIQMAKQLNLNIVAEGVETQAEWDVIAGLGCDVVQGYLIAKPMKQEVFIDWYPRYIASIYDGVE